MRGLGLFTALVACSSAPTQIVTPAPVVVTIPDAAQPVKNLSIRGGHCTDDKECAPGLRCFDLPGGYCASDCDATCDGTCVETAMHGSICMAGCTACREDEGYVCSANACTLPDLGLLEQRECHGKGDRDKAFGASELVGAGTEPSADPLGIVYETAQGLSLGAIGHDAVLARGGSTLFAAWRDSETIQLAVSSDGTTWSKSVAVNADGELGHPMLAASAKQLFVMYGDADHGLRVRASHDHGVTFAPPITPIAGTYGNAVIDDTGALHVVALEGSDLGAYGSAMQKIAYVTSKDGATFTQPLTVNNIDETLPTWFANPAIAVDARRKWIYVAYIRGSRTQPWDLVIAAWNGKAWTRRTIGDGCTDHFVPNLALDPQTGTLHVAYYDNADGGRFVHATCSVGAAQCTPWGAINGEPFVAPFPTGRHSPRSVGDHESLYIDKRVLHAVWAQPDATGSRIFHASAKLTANGR